MFKHIRMCIHHYAIKIGHRGAFLLFLSMLDFLYGYSLYIIPRSPIPFFIPIHIWAWLWIVSGAIALSGVMRKHDQFQFGWASFFKCLWAASWLRLWIIHGVPQAWAEVVLWVGFAAIISIIATWPEVRRYRSIAKDCEDVVAEHNTEEMG